MGGYKMALNLSQGSVLRNYSSPEHGLCSSARCCDGYVRDQCKEKNLDGGASSSNSDSKMKYVNFSEASDDNILERLPVDPFGMDMRSTITTISGWLDGFEKGCESYDLGVDQKKKEKMVVDSGGLFAGLNWVWNNIIQPELGEVTLDGISVPYDSIDGYGINDGGLVLDDNFLEEFLGMGHLVNLNVSYGAKEQPNGIMEKAECSINKFDMEEGAPHDAMFYALGYLGIRDLLSVEQVCRSLNRAVKSDPLLWRSISIEWPLNEIISDDALVNLTSRAQGNLQTLSLVHCASITDTGLHHVFDSNPKLKNLSIPGCIKISIESILLNLRTMKSAGKPGIKQLRIGGLSGITDKQFEELKFLLCANNNIQANAQKPRYFHGGLSHLSCDEDCAIDIEACPRCQRLSLVYDCPTETCQGKQKKTQMCRACILCITRCISCGCCLGDCDYVETFCLQFLCLECWENLFRYQESHGELSVPKCAIFCQQRRYQFCVFG